MQSAVADGVFPGAVLVISLNRQVACHHAYGLANSDTGLKATTATVYDLASLTKPLATTLAVLKLIAEGELELASRIGDVLPDFANTEKAAIEIKHLLYHTAGLPDWRPYFRSLSTLPAGERAAELMTYLAREPLVSRVGAKCRYSDLGFMILHRLVEVTTGQGLDRFVHEQFYRPLGISDLFFIPDSNPRLHRDYAATEKCTWRRRTLSGEVHDENAAAMGGVAGQSGLFGTAAGVHQLLAALIDIYSGKAGQQLLPADLLKQAFTRCSECQRGLGFDCPDKVGSSSGSHFSHNSVGHLGYTGTSFWVDLERSITVILLSNRVHPSRTNDAIKQFRPILHDTIMTRLPDTDS
jgi:CubicO group peptidase (beta-lactamase class C family)